MRREGGSKRERHGRGVPLRDRSISNAYDDDGGCFQPPMGPARSIRAIHTVN